MDFSGILEGFATAFQPINILYVFLGVLIGTVVGVLPGIGPTATIAVLLPLTFGLEPATAVIMLAGIYYGCMYGGTITSVLLSIPGEATSTITVIDGYQMARKGHAGKALGISAIGSFVGGTVAVVGLMFLAPVVASVAILFGPPEYFLIAVLGLLLITYLGTGSPVKALVMAALGLLLAVIGSDPLTGQGRFTFGDVSLFDGLGIAPIAMGLFGVGEILHSLEKTEKVEAIKAKFRDLWPSRADLRQSAGPIARGSLIGFFVGLLPGGGGFLASLFSYTAEKRRAKDPSRFGKGAIEGVAGPETANNAASTSNFVPLLTLGLPSNAVLALIFSALLMQGITPGPSLVNDHPDIFWGVIASMYLGNIFLLVLNLPLVGVFVQLLRVRLTILGPVTILLTMIGVYAVQKDVSEMVVVLVFGVLGWLMKKTGFPPAPLVLAFVLGPILEQAFRQSMLISHGSLDIFVARPGAIVIVIMIVGVLSFNLVSTVRARRKEVDLPTLDDLRKQL